MRQNVWDRTSETECLGQNVSIAGQYGTGTERWDRRVGTERLGSGVDNRGYDRLVNGQIGVRFII